MTRMGRRLIEDFLLPSLNDGRYGELLKWVDRDKNLFSIRWSHKNAAKWSLDDTIVFQDWDKLKGHFHPEHKGYYMQAKQRFRAALYKLNTVRKLYTDDKHEKLYALTLDPRRRKIDISAADIPKVKHPKKVVENNRVSVITKHSSLSKQPNAIYYAPPIEDKNQIASQEDSDSEETNEFANCIHDYRLGQKNHNHMIRSSHHFNYIPHVLPRKESPLKEVNDDLNRNGSYLQRSPHMPIQPVPVYTTSSQKRYESPNYIVVPTYHDEVVKAQEEYLSNQEVDDDSSDCGVLNLSIKSDDSDHASR